MAFNFDGAGEIRIPIVNEPGNFSVSLPPVQYVAGATQIILGRENDTGTLLAILDGGIVRLKVDGETVDTVASLEDGEMFVPSFSRDGSTVTLDVEGYASVSMEATGSLVLDRFGSGNGSQLVYQGLIDNGVATIVGDNTPLRTYDFSPSSGTELVDLEGGTDGQVVSFTSGGFVEGTPASLAVADAGDDITGKVSGDSFQLDGSATTGNASQSWVQTGGSTTATITNETTLTPTVTIPAATSAQTMEFTLTVLDSNGDPSTDTVSVFVIADDVTPTIEITSVVDYEFRAGGVEHRANIPIEGTVSNLESGGYVQYRTVNTYTDGDVSDWLPLDANPTATTFSGVVNVHYVQTVEVRISNETTATDSVILGALFSVCEGPSQSNGDGRVNAGQSDVERGFNAGVAIPLMRKVSTFGPLEHINGYDTTTKGSLWLGIAENLANDDGITIGLGNVAEGGTAWAEWVPGTSLFNRIRNYAAAVGGIDMITCLIGETDSGLENTTEEILTSMRLAIDAINSEFDTPLICITYIPKTAYNFPERLRDANTQIISEYDNVYNGGDLSVVSMSGSDGTHIQSLAQYNAAFPIRYEAIKTAITDFYLTTDVVLPTANAGPSQSVSAGAPVQLDASSSTQGTYPIASYEWSVSPLNAVALVNGITATPSFTAPISDSAQTLTFSVVAIDTEGNRSATATTSVQVSAEVDITPPVITLTGGNIVLNVNEEFQEPGYMAVDDKDGNITANVVVAGSTDTSYPRVGEITYNVSDSAGNAAATKTRLFTVIEVSELLEEVSKQKFTIEDKAIIHAFPGRSNLEKVRFKLASTNTNIAVDKTGCYDFDENETQKVEVITVSGTVSSESGDVEWEGGDLYIRAGAFSSMRPHESARVVVYLANDDRGVVFAGPGLPANLIIHFN